MNRWNSLTVRAKQPFGYRFTHLFIGLTALIIGMAYLPVLKAQTCKQADEILKSYSAKSRDVVSILTALNHLPGEEWRFHAGDLTHGESPTLDDSSWQVVKPRMEAPKEAVWFRRWVEVPKALNGYDLTGARIWLHFFAYANGPMPEIIYFNGRRVAMGDDLEP